MNLEPGSCNSRLSTVKLLLLYESSAAPVDTGGLFIFGTLLLAVGLLSVVRPRFFWNIGIGRKAEMPPPAIYLMMLRFGGILLCAVAAVMIYKVL